MHGTLKSWSTAFLSICISGRKISIVLSIPGIFSVYNARLQLQPAMRQAYPLRTYKGPHLYKGVLGRFKPGCRHRLFNYSDYAHTDGLENILKTGGLTDGRLVTLFGCGGDRDAAKRPMMGEVAGRYSDLCIITSDNPRYEDPVKIIEDILPGIAKTHCPYKVIVDRREAIEYAIKNARENDLIILAGKGHETYQIIKGIPILL